MQALQSFHELCLCTPTRSLPWTSWGEGGGGADSTPRPPAVSNVFHRLSPHNRSSYSIRGSGGDHPTQMIFYTIDQNQISYSCCLSRHLQTGKNKDVCFRTLRNKGRGQKQHHLYLLLCVSQFQALPSPGQSRGIWLKFLPGEEGFD